MKEFLDKTGLEYFYNKLCSVFIKKGESVKYTVSAADIQNALGYSPLSIAYFNKNITDIKNDQQYMSEQFEKLRDYAGEVGVNVDNANKSITSLASSLSEDKNSINIVKQQLDAQKGTIESLARNYNSTNAALTNVATKLDAQNGLIDNLVTRANTQGVSIAQIRQQVTDTQASIKASVSIDEVEAAIEARVFDDNGSLKSDIMLNANQVYIGERSNNYLKSDGSGSLANGNIAWDTEGNISNLNIGGNKSSFILDNVLLSDGLDLGLGTDVTATDFLKKKNGIYGIEARSSNVMTTVGWLFSNGDNMKHQVSQFLISNYISNEGNINNTHEDGTAAMSIRYYNMSSPILTNESKTWTTWETPLMLHHSNTSFDCNVEVDSKLKVKESITIGGSEGAKMTSQGVMFKYTDGSEKTITWSELYDLINN